MIRKNSEMRSCDNFSVLTKWDIIRDAKKDVFVSNACQLERSLLTGSLDNGWLAGNASKKGLKRTENKAPKCLYLAAITCRTKDYPLSLFRATTTDVDVKDPQTTPVTRSASTVWARKNNQSKAKCVQQLTSRLLLSDRHLCRERLLFRFFLHFVASYCFPARPKKKLSCSSNRKSLTDGEQNTNHKIGGATVKIR